MNAEVLNKSAQLHWFDVKNRVQAIAPELSQLLNALDNNRNLEVIVARYPYGQDIVKAGSFTLPEALANCGIKEKLTYSKIPVGLVLDKSIEVYYETPERIIPDKIWGAGRLFGLWELFDAPAKIDSCQYSNLSSGVRSLFMCSKISDRAAHARLQKAFSFRNPPPTTMREHRDLFAKLASSGDADKRWYCSILYLTNEWFADKNSQALTALYSNFLERAWVQSFNCRRQFELQVAWESVLNAMRKRNIYLQPRLSSHIKQLYLISEGIFPGMVFAEDHEEDVAPIKLIQEIYRDIYQLRHHDPLLMRPQHLQPNQPVYYSLNFPSYFETHIPIKSIPRLADETRFLAKTMQVIHNEVRFEADASPLFKFYHSQVERDALVLNSSQLIYGDPKLQKYAIGDKGCKRFPDNSLFFRGCVKINLAGSENKNEL